MREVRNGGARWRHRERKRRNRGGELEDKALDGAGVQIYCAIGFERAVNAEKESVMDLARAVQGKASASKGTSILLSVSGRPEPIVSEGSSEREGQTSGSSGARSAESGLEKERGGSVSAACK